MRLKKEELREKIIENAKADFFIKGYEKTSMRVIANESDISLSNIYTYFKNKDEILEAVAKPLMSAINEMMVKHNSAEFISLEVFDSSLYQRETMNLFIELIKEYKQELYLFLFSAHGSIYANFKEELIDYYTQSSFDYFKMMDEKYPYLHTNISHFFIHSHCSAFVSVIGELVSHDISDEEIQTYVSEYIEFNTAGWEKIMRVKPTKTLGVLARVF